MASLVCTLASVTAACAISSQRTEGPAPVAVECDEGFDRDASGRCARWTSVPDSPHLGAHTLVLLDDGRVALLGALRDDNDSPLEQTVGIFDPDANAWTLQDGPTFTERTGWTATALDAHRVLVVGAPQALLRTPSDAFVFDVDTHTITGVAIPGAASRREHSAQRLRDGRVWIAGGVDGTSNRIASSVLFDAATRSFREGPTLAAARALPKLALLGDDVIVVGGQDADLPATSERCSFDDNECVSAASIALRGLDSDFTLAGVDEGTLLLVSFYGVAAYSSRTNEWISRAMPAYSRTSASGVATLLDGGVLLVSMDPYAVPHAPEVYDHLRDEWFVTAEQPAQTWDGELITLLDGRVLVTSSSTGTQLYERR